MPASALIRSTLFNMKISLHISAFEPLSLRNSFNPPPELSLTPKFDVLIEIN